MLYDLARGRRPAPCFQYDIGLEYRWLLHELARLARTPGRARTLRELAGWRHVATDVWAGDPLPHAAKMLANLWRLARRPAGTEDVSSAPTRR
jgi:hypothetical protein